MRNKYYSRMLSLIPLFGMAFLLLCFSTTTAIAQPLSGPVCAKYSENFKTNGDSFFDVVLSYDGTIDDIYLGWCIDPYSGPPPWDKTEDCETYLYSTLDPSSLPNGYQDIPWNEINWILNNKNGYPNSVIQPAIWYLITGDAHAWTWSCGSECFALVNEALAHGDFVPGCGDTVAVILIGKHDDGIAFSYRYPTYWQDIIIEVPIDCEGIGRFTGGGHQIRVEGVRVTRGFTIHCDLLLSNNLEINWGGNQFHMTEHVTTVECIDDPAIDPIPPPAPVDTITGIGTGRYNGEYGYTIEFKLVDDGEPGTSDQAAFLIYETANPANVILNIPLTYITGGNIQAHYDQPHK